MWGKQTQFKPNFKPKLQKARMDVSLAITRNYNNEQRTMNNERLCKTNPNKANFNTKIAGFLVKIGFVWVCFPCGGEFVHFHNPLLKLSLRSFGHPVDWVCFGFVLGLIGFELGLFLLA